MERTDIVSSKWWIAIFLLGFLVGCGDSVEVESNPETDDTTVSPEEEKAERELQP